MGKPVYPIVRIYFDTGYNASIKHVITYNVILFYKNVLLCKKSRIYRFTSFQVLNKKSESSLKKQYNKSDKQS